MIKIFDIPFKPLKYKELFTEITSFRKQRIVFTPNPEICLKTLSDSEFNNLLLQANYLTADGIGLYIAFQILEEKNKLLSYIKLPIYFYNIFFNRALLYQKYGDRICWSDLTKDLLYHSEVTNTPITILDLYNPTDKPKVASQKVFSNKLQKAFPKLKFDYFIYNPEKKSEIISSIKASHSKVIFSTLGMKRQEKSVIEVMKQCKDIKLWLWIGSGFDYFIWFQKRAPKLIRSLWFEWLYRLLTGPRKLDRIKRLYSAIFIFIATIYKYKK